MERVGGVLERVRAQRRRHDGVLSSTVRRDPRQLGHKVLVFHLVVHQLDSATHYDVMHIVTSWIAATAREDPGRRVPTGKTTIRNEALFSSIFVVVEFRKSIFILQNSFTIKKHEIPRMCVFSHDSLYNRNRMKITSGALIFGGGADVKH